jgi:ABC-type Fe3+ transport system permease subunit
VESLPPEHKDLALSLGMKNYSYIKNYLWPEVGPSIWRLSLLFSLWSLGEYTFSKAFLSRSSTLALFIEEKLRRYQFAEASLALSLSLSISVIVVTLLLWKGRKNAAL